jgi:hypothetical protein
MESSPIAQNVRRRKSGVMDGDVQAMATYKDGYAEVVVTAFRILK